MKESIADGIVIDSLCAAEAKKTWEMGKALGLQYADNEK